jgi:hypothetical protein
MLATLAYGLCLTLNLLFLVIGARFLLTPRVAAAAYGVPADTGIAFLTAKGLRDGTYGLAGLALLAFAGSSAAAWFMLLAALLPAGDTVIVLRNGGARAIAFGIHFATAVLVLLDATFLFTL